MATSAEGSNQAATTTVGTIEVLDSEEAFHKFISRDGMTLVHFSADWCPSCGQLNEIMKELEAEYPNEFQLGEVDAEKLAKLTEQQKVTAVPTVLFFKGGKLLDRLPGFHPAELRSLIVQHFFSNQIKEHTEGIVGTMEKSASIKGTNPDIVATETLEDRLKRLINKSRLMLFMKGSADSPKCGFSRQIVQMLREVGAHFSTFDILEDEAVRQGLKSYSDWPTYPQLYLDGELLGGLDVVREEMKSSDFVAKLPK